MNEMIRWLESEAHKKVWHNYSFDRHVLFGMGIDAKGFAADTMHMARLWDTSREKTRKKTTKTTTAGAATAGAATAGAAAGANRNNESVVVGGYSLSALTSELLGRRKASMKELFGVPKMRKDGTPGSIIEVRCFDCDCECECYCYCDCDCECECECDCECDCKCDCDCECECECECECNCDCDCDCDCDG